MMQLKHMSIRVSFGHMLHCSSSFFVLLLLLALMLLLLYLVLLIFNYIFTRTKHIPSKIELLMNHTMWQSLAVWRPKNNHHTNVRTRNGEHIIAKWYNLVAILCQKYKKYRKLFFQTWNEMKKKTKLAWKKRANEKKVDRSYRSDDSHSWKTSKLRRLNSVVHIIYTIDYAIRIYLFFRAMATFQSCAWSCEMNSTNFILIFTQTQRWKKYTKNEWWIFLVSIFDSVPENDDVSDETRRIYALR